MKQEILNSQEMKGDFNQKMLNFNMGFTHGFEKIIIRTLLITIFFGLLTIYCLFKFLAAFTIIQSVGRHLFVTKWNMGRSELHSLHHCQSDDVHI